MKKSFVSLSSVNHILLALSICMLPLSALHASDEDGELPEQKNDTSKKTDETSVIYQYVDENGVTNFTDQPIEGAKAIKGKPLITTNIGAPSSLSNPLSLSSKKEEKTSTNYNSLNIIEPANDSVVRNNAGVITLRASVEPALKSHHKLRFFLDGKPVNATANSLSVVIDKAEYGEHTASFIIVDKNNSVVDSSETIKFHLLNRINNNK
jgi:hypothetical protein